jgi:hypothetical protein
MTRETETLLYEVLVELLELLRRQHREDERDDDQYRLLGALWRSYGYPPPRRRGRR